MLCAVINGPSADEAKQQIFATKDQAALFEFRLDLFHSRDIRNVQELKSFAAKPVIFTLRPSWMGGNYQESEEARLHELLSFCSLHPEYIDIEHGVSHEYIDKLQKLSPKVKIILSHHDFEKTPDLKQLHTSLQATPAHYYKMALYAGCSSDAFRLMLYLKEIKEKVIGVSMGPYGLPSRILPNLWTYVATDKVTAPGQLTCHEMVSTYGCTKKAKLFGLIGAPVNKSISHKTHNAVMREYNLDAIYLKMEVAPANLKTFLNQLQDFGFEGLSVTMPLKEAILPFVELHGSAAAIGAVNTLQFKEGKILGYNTDGKGAVRALEKKCSLKGKTIALIGKGGAAKAIAYEAEQCGANPELFGRGYVYQNADIVINCTPVELPFDPSRLSVNTLVMDINTLPKKSTLLLAAEAKGCPVIYGYEMFLEQALLQFLLWFPHLDPISLETSLRRECENLLN